MLRKNILIKSLCLGIGYVVDNLDQSYRKVTPRNKVNLHVSKHISLNERPLSFVVKKWVLKSRLLHEYIR